MTANWLNPDWYSWEDASSLMLGILVFRSLKQYKILLAKHCFSFSSNMSYICMNIKPIQGKGL